MEPRAEAKDFSSCCQVLQAMITGWFQCCYLKGFNWLLKGSLDLECTTRHSYRRFSSTIPLSPHSYLLLLMVVSPFTHAHLDHWGETTICCLGDINLSWNRGKAAVVDMLPWIYMAIYIRLHMKRDLYLSSCRLSSQEGSIWFYQPIISM